MCCRINKQRKWVLRLLLEARCHPYSSFVTLTYDQEHVPLVVDPDDGCPRESLKKEHYHKWTRRLSRISPAPLRFYGCGEYGSLTSRPHYHAIVFGFGVHQLPILKESWKRGFVDIQEASIANMAYSAKYTLKNMNNPQDESLRGRRPTFSRMSLRPPIGATSIPSLGTSLKTTTGSRVLASGLYQKQVRIHNRRFALDRTMTKYLAENLDLSQEEAKILLSAPLEQDTDEEIQKAQAINAKLYRKSRRKSAGL